MDNKQQYIDFEQYIRQGEPDQKEKAYLWSTAIGLQAVDGLSTSEYLQQTAKRNIEGEITIDEAQELVKEYYVTRQAHEANDDDKEEADRASANISKILSSTAFEFSTNGIISLHRRIFEGVFKHAGKIRDYDITKKEWVLGGDTVRYLNNEDLRRALDYDIQQEKEFDYSGLSIEEFVVHFSHFISGIWEIHAFSEGNTRTTAVFAIQYLRTLGFNVNTNLFANHSWYFRNALVRANYYAFQPVVRKREIRYLERFFRNLLMDEQWVLKSRYLVLDPPEGYQEQPRLDKPEGKGQAPDKHPTSTRQAPDKWLTNNPNIISLINVIGMEEKKIKDILVSMGLRNRESFIDVYLNPAMKEGFVRMLYPDSPRHPRQKYLLTVKGLGLFHQLNK